jgi:glycerol-3-phosphate dehydrogenase (NAD(P)+)
VATVRIAILGAGNLGTSLGIVLAGGVPGIRAGRARDVVLWTIEADVAQEIRGRRANTKYLPGAPLPRALAVTTDLNEALSLTDIVLFALPSKVVRSVARQTGALFGAPATAGASPGGRAGAPAGGATGAPPGGTAGGALFSPPVFISASKGLEEESFLRMSQVIAEELPERLRPRVLAMSGPSIAHELSRGMPTAVTLACHDVALAREVRRELRTPVLRFQISRDVPGVELGGVLKNAYALALGLCDGLGLGLNTKAAVLTKALPELTRLGVALGGRRATFYGLPGLGDLIGTGLSTFSRNRKLGEELARRRPKEEALASIPGVVEGVAAATMARRLAASRGLKLPLLETIAAVLEDGADPLKAILRIVG